MIQRCTNPKRKDFHRYGGRGIKVCNRWLTFENFLADMGPRPAGLLLDRLNNDGDYEPSNCEWRTKAQQVRNRCTNRVLTYQGRTMCIMDWAAEIGAPWSSLFYRINRGWTVERALSEPFKRRAT
jgi:hypothetical protein